MRIRTSLLLLALAVAIPLLGFALLAAGLVVRQENENFISAAKVRNRATMSAAEAELRDSINTLHALGSSPALTRNDLAAYEEVLRAALGSQPDWNNLLLHHPSGRILLDASRPRGLPLHDKPAAPSSIQAAVTTLQPAVDGLVSVPDSRFGIPVRVPIVRDGKAVYVLTALLSPDRFQKVLARQSLPERWVSGFVDSEGRLIARVPPVPVGSTAAKSYLDNIRSANEGWFRSATLEGAEVYTAFLRSEQTGWTIGYAVPAEVVTGNAKRSARLMGAGVALSIAAALLIGFWLSRRISAPIASLASATDAISRGERVAVPQTARIAEIGRLARALHECVAALREREERLQLALDAGRMGNWEWHVQSNKVTWSADLEAIHGLAPGTFPGTFEAYKKDIHPDDRERVRQAIAASLEQNEHHVEYRIVRPDGGTRWVEGRGKVFREEGGAPVRVVGVCADITERKQAEQALAQRAHLLDLSHDAIFVHDRDFRILYWNPGAEEIYGWKADEALGKVKTELLHTEFHQPLEDIQKQMLLTGRWSGELVHQRRDGARIAVSSRWALERDEKGEPGFVLELNRDITEAKRAEQALRDADRHKDEFLAMLSHELRNPLAGLTAAAHVLNVAEPSSDAAMQARGVVERQTTHMSRLVADLLDVSRLTLGKLALQRTRMDMADAVSSLVNAWRASGRLDAHHVLLAAEPVWVDADRERIEQIAANLLDNALKFTPAGGAVSIAVRREGGEAVLRLADQGAGLAGEDCRRVFDLFAQAEPAGRASSAGLGIGLALVKRLAELHDGSVSVSSEGRGRGAVFTVRLPAVERPPRVDAPPSRINGARSILIVEDNEDARRMLAALLALGGHFVRAAPDGRTGLALAAAAQPDMALIDIGLPDMDGYEVARRLRAAPASARLLLVAVTGFAQEQDRQRAREAGFDAHLAKPVSADRFEQLLVELQ